MNLEVLLKLAVKNGLIKAYAINANRIEVNLGNSTIITTPVTCQDKLLQCGVDITPPIEDLPVQEEVLAPEEVIVEEPNPLPRKTTKRQSK